MSFESDILKAVGDDPNGVSTNQICRLLRNTPQELGAAFEMLRGSGKLVGFAGLWLSPTAFVLGVRRFMEALHEHHEKSPTQAFVPAEQIAQSAGLQWEGKPLDRIVARLESGKELVVGATGVRSGSVSLQLTPRQRALLNRVVGALELEPVNTPTPHQISQLFGIPREAVEEILKLGTQAGEIVQVDEAVFYTPQQIEDLKTTIVRLTVSGAFSTKDLKEKLNTSRKYIEPLLNYFDSIGFIKGPVGHKSVQV